ncbi:uncharacterized protein LOC116351802 [Contarinia nasturtii]|uniref:uncharacterized protein LOC116351802 n=1 Tax=Contarinia nasturtii TaxID=265458 RepID=UPI0012D3C1FC|nr:uncharacterized protein LOC116351802 [Contarinia nasturtii]
MNQRTLNELRNAGREVHLQSKNLDEVKDLLRDIAQKTREKITSDVKNRAVSLIVDAVLKQQLQNTVDQSRNETLVRVVTATNRNDMNDEGIDQEIEEYLALNEMSDDEALDILFRDADDEPNEAAIEENETLLSVITENLNNAGVNVIWNVNGVNCADHTLQLGIKDGIKATSQSDRNVMKLCKKVAVYLRLDSTMHELRNNGLKHVKPRLEVATRWGSLYMMMSDIVDRKANVEHLGMKGHKSCQLLLHKWNTLVELMLVLKDPFKRTIQLQREDLTLSDAYGIWTKMRLYLQAFSRKVRTGFGACLYEAIKERQKTIFINPVLQSSLYLDPRFRSEITRDEEKCSRAIEFLSNLYCRIQEIKNAVSETTSPKNSIIMSVSSERVVNDDFDSPGRLKKYLERNSLSTTPNESLELPTQSEQSTTGSDIKTIIESFQPKHLDLNGSILNYWELEKENSSKLYEIASVLYATPPTEVQIERDFSTLEFIFSQRRGNISNELLEDILLINLKSDIFEEIRKEKLAYILHEESQL